MIKRFYGFNAMMDEVRTILGGAAEAVLYEGKKEFYKKGNKTVEVEKMWYFDDDNGNVYDLKLES